LRRYTPWMVVLALLGLGLAWLARAAPERDIGTPETSAPPPPPASMPAPETAAITPAQVAVDPDQREPVADEASRVELAGDGTGVLAGRVVDQDGAPVPGVAVVLNPIDGPARRAAEVLATCIGGPTDADGRFAVPAARQGRWCVTAQGSELVECLGVEVDLALPVPDLIVTVRLGELVRGSVRWADGRDVKVFRVRAASSYGVNTANGRYGRFALRARGARVTITAEAPSRGTLARATLEDVSPAEVGAEGIELVLVDLPTLAVRGTVVGPDGQPVPGAEVRAWGRERRDGPQAVIADGEGRFELGLSSGPWRLVAGSQSRFAAALELVVKGDLENVVLALGPMPTISGTVVDAAARPIAGAVVLGASDPSEFVALLARDQATAGADGRFELAVGASPIWLQARAPDGRTSADLAVELVAGQRIDGLVVAVRERASLRLRLRHENGDPAAGAHLLLMAPEGSTRDLLLDSDGRALCEGLSAGLYAGNVDTRDGETYFVPEIRVAAGVNELEQVLQLFTGEIGY